MNDSLKKLAAEGCDISKALERTGNDEAFLIKCMEMVLDDDSFMELGRAIEAGDVEKGFGAAHSLKGICANTGLDPLTTLSSEITEVLRAKSLEGLEPMYAQLMETHAQLKEILG